MRNPICPECTKRLRNYGFICFDFMHSICSVYLDSNITAIAQDAPAYLHTILSFLESKRLVVSLDTKRAIIIKPNADYDTCRKVYCWCKD